MKHFFVIYTLWCSKASYER